MKAITLGILAGVGIAAFLVMNFLPSPTGGATAQDSFARCLTNNGAIFYGSFQCSHCAEQKVLLGASMKSINYVECGPLQGPMNPACIKAGIEVFPTWIINGTKYEGVQSVDTLAKLTGCSTGG